MKRTHQNLASSAWPTVVPLAHAEGCRFRWRGRIATFALSAGTAARASVAARGLRGLRGETNSGWLSLKRHRGSSTILSLLNPFLPLSLPQLAPQLREDEPARTSELPLLTSSRVVSTIAPQKWSTAGVKMLVCLRTYHLPVTPCKKRNILFWCVLELVLVLANVWTSPCNLGGKFQKQLAISCLLMLRQ